MNKKLHKPIIRTFEKREVHSLFIDNIWGVNSADKFNKEICFLLWVIDIFNKYVSVVPLKNKNGITITDAFLNILNESVLKGSKKWIDRGNKFCDRTMKSWLEKMI